MSPFRAPAASVAAASASTAPALFTPTTSRSSTGSRSPPSRARPSTSPASCAPASCCASSSKPPAWRGSIFRALQAAIDRNLNREGTKALRAILADFTVAPPTRSELERHFLEVVTAAGLPLPRLNVKVAGFEVDAYWPQWDLIVELDGRGFHSDPRSFERDRVRDGRLQQAAKRVLRVTYKRLHQHPSEVVADIEKLAALAERRAQGHSQRRAG